MMKMNLARLKAIETTLQAIEDIDKALELYSQDLPGPAYLVVKKAHALKSPIEIQFEREHFRQFMNERKQELIKNLEDRFDGFEYDSEASWSGDKKED